MAVVDALRFVPLVGDTDVARDEVGNKAWGIMRMRSLGLPVPPAFVLPVGECRRYHDKGQALDEQTWDAVLAGLRWLEAETGKAFGDPESPLLVSVRSGAVVSMPGMMDTVLNLGITDAVEAALARSSGDPAFARDTHARFCHQFGKVVLGADVEPDACAKEIDALRQEVARDCGRAFPLDPYEQLRLAVCAVFQSWGSRRAIAYRKHWGLSELGGTAVTIQAMVFGNLSGQSGTGVFFTRDPLTGEPSPYGEWLPGGQGEDVVSGTHAVQTLSDLAQQQPDVHAELLRAGEVLERENGDVQDIEFTVEQGRLFLLQTRAAKRSPAAAVRTAVDFVEEGVIEPDVALARVTPEQVRTLLQPRLSPDAVTSEPLAVGEPACFGVASGIAVGDSEAAERAAAAGQDVVLVRPTTSPEDIAGMIAARAVVTELGGATSHAAVVARALGRPCVVGIGPGSTSAWLGRPVTVDGSRGAVYDGLLPTEQVHVEEDPGLSRLLQWAREACPVAVGADPSAGLRDLDAAGIGLDADEPPALDDVVAALQGAAAARGAVLSTAVGADALLQAQVPVVQLAPGQHELMVLLQLVHAHRRCAAPADVR